MLGTHCHGKTILTEAEEFVVRRYGTRNAALIRSRWRQCPRGTPGLPTGGLAGAEAVVHAVSATAAVDRDLIQKPGAPMKTPPLCLLGLHAAMPWQYEVCDHKPPRCCNRIPIWDIKSSPTKSRRPQRQSPALRVARYTMPAKKITAGVTRHRANNHRSPRSNATS